MPDGAGHDPGAHGLDVPKAIVAVLAGGAGKRIGGQKAMVELCGRPLIERPLAAAAEAGLEAVVVAKQDSELPDLAVPVWREPDEPRHPLAGVVEALRRCEGRPVVAAACDMPFLTPGFLGWLASFREQAVVPSAGGRLHPLIAHYGPNALGPLAAATSQGLSAREAVRALSPRLVEEGALCRFGTIEHLLMNVNTPEDLELSVQVAACKAE
jgi:molybdopterin-guanine dinucleotide biosynthesis protein A